MRKLVPLPTPTLLAERLSSALSGDVSVIERKRNVYTSTFPSEIVSCVLPDGAPRDLFLKYMRRDTPAVVPRTTAPRYEVDVFRHVLEPLPVLTPRFYGSWLDEAGDEAWLIMEYIDRGRRLMHVKHPMQAIEAAAGWLGAFHRAAGEHITDGDVRFLRRFDRGHYVARRDLMTSTSSHLLDGNAWLPPLLDRFDRVVDLLTHSRQTVIHGEFYPKNILNRAGKVYPVDWETAAIAPGEIDFATLTEAWEPQFVERATEAYRKARFGEDLTDGFDERVAAATVYVNVHWLGFAAIPTQPKWNYSTVGDWRLEALRKAGRGLGLLS